MGYVHQVAKIVPKLEKSCYPFENLLKMEKNLLAKISIKYILKNLIKDLAQNDHFIPNLNMGVE